MIPMLRKSDPGQEFELNVEDENGPMIIKAADSIGTEYERNRTLAAITKREMM